MERSSAAQPFVFFLLVEFLASHQIALRVYLTIVFGCGKHFTAFVSNPYDMAFHVTREINKVLCIFETL